MTRTVFLRTLLHLALFFSLTIASFAQYGASLQGTVRDESGAAVVGATVTAANQATGVSRGANTSESGFYRISGRPPGIYSVDVAASTFKKSSSPDIQVAAEAPRGLDITLQPGPAQETMTVTTTGGGYN